MSGIIRDRVAVLCDVNTATTDTDDSGLLIIATTQGNTQSTNVLFDKSPDEGSTPYPNVSGLIGEFWRARCGFLVKEKCTIQNINITIQVQVIDGDGNTNSFDIETWNNPTDSFYNGLFTDIQIKQSQGFFLINDSVFDVKKIERDSTIDVGSYYGYYLSYGFQLGYTWWQNINEFVKQFETYRTQYWAAYSQNKVVGGNPIQTDGGSASIKFILTWGILDNTTGIVTQFNRTCDVVCNDAAYTNTITGVISTKDAIYGDDLNQQISNDAQTTITGTFSGPGIGTAPGSDSIIGEMAVYYQDGTTNRYDRICSGVDLLDDSIFIAQPTVVVVDANTITVSGTCDIKAKLGTLNGQTRTRIYVKYDYAPSGLLTDSGIQIQTDGGQNIFVD